MSDAPKQTVTIKKYANRRLYNTATSSYVTLDDLSAMTRENIDFNVYDAKTGEDITRSVLTQIMVEEEGKTGQNLLPVSFLRQLIGFYGDNMQWLVPKYLEHSMSSLAQNQEQIRSYFQTTFGNMFPFGSTLEEMGKQNMAVFERAMRVFTPFSTESAPSTTTSSTSTPSSTSSKPAAAEKETARTSNASSSSRSSSASSALASVTEEDDSEDDAMAEDAFTPSSNIRAIPLAATAQAAAKAAPASGEDVQQKIAALQRQLADLARNKG